MGRGYVLLTPHSRHSFPALRTNAFRAAERAASTAASLALFCLDLVYPFPASLALKLVAGRPTISG